MAPRKTYTEAFKRAAVQLASQRGIAPTARGLGLSPSTLRRWINQRPPSDRSTRKQAIAGPSPEPGHPLKPTSDELVELKREDTFLRDQTSRLKRALGLDT